MTELFLVLLRILFPLDPVARLREVTRDYLSEIMGWLDDPLDVAEIARRPDWLEILEAHIIVAENGVELLITERARQIAGLPFIYTRRMAPPHLRKVKSLSRLLNRITHLARLFHNLERLAARRADRLRSQQSPLRLDASHQSTSPALRAAEATCPLQLNVQIASLSPQDWGRWIGASSRRDGGGCASPRGPPPNPVPKTKLPHLAGPTCENAPA